MKLLLLRNRKHFSSQYVIIQREKELEMEEHNENSTKTSVETDYAAHEENPGPSEAAIKEKSDKGASKVMNWAIVIAIIALIIAYFLFM